jgi:hypothetical protein
MTLIGLGASSPVAWTAAVAASAAGAGRADATQPTPTTSPVPSAETQSTEDPLLLPDLMTLPPDNVHIVNLASGRLLRFSNTVWNGGEGPLELLGLPDPASRSILVTQRAYTAGGAAAEWAVGQFVFHPTHDHWHLDGFVVYQLWSVGLDGDLDRLITSSGKISYCLIDTTVVDREDPLRPSGRQYYGCGRVRQGLSVGWGDTYLSHLDGQSLPLDGIPDGLYALVSTVNASRMIRETLVSNNAAVVYMAISGTNMTLMTRSDISRIVWLTKQ